jgi:hypothetical protein
MDCFRGCGCDHCSNPLCWDEEEFDEYDDEDEDAAA